MEPSVAASTQNQGPARFHNAKARLKRRIGAATSDYDATREASVPEESDVTSDEESLPEHAFDGFSGTFQPYESDNDSVVIENRHDSVFSMTADQTLPANTISALTARPQRRNLRHALGPSEYRKSGLRTVHTRADEEAALNHERNGESLASMRRVMNEGFARLSVHQRQLDQVVAHMNQTFSSHLEDDRAFRQAQAAQEAAADRVRALEAQRRVYAKRVGQRIVAEVVPRAAHGRAYSDVEEIRRCAAQKVEFQMVPDGKYPRFCPSSYGAWSGDTGAGREC